MVRYLGWGGLAALLALLAGCQTTVMPVEPIDWVWSYRAGDYIRGGASSTGEVVYIGSDDNSLHAVDAETGESAWAYETADNVTSAPAVDNDGVYFGSWDGTIYALDSAGDVRWSHPTDGWISAAPLLHQGILYIGSHDGYFRALNAQNGELLWQYHTNGRIESDAVPWGGLVVFSSTDGYVHALDAESGQRQWFFHTDGPVVSAPVVAGDRLITGSQGGKLTAVEAASGVSLWSYTADDALSASPAVQGEKLFVGTEGGDVFALRTSDGRPLWKQTIGEPIRAAPTVWNSLVFVGTRDGNLYALDSDSGALLWRYRLGGSITQGPNVFGNRLYVGSTSKDLQAFDLNEESLDQLEPLSSFFAAVDVPFDAQEAAAHYAQETDGEPDLAEYGVLWEAKAALPELESVRSLQDVISFRPESPAAYLAYVALARHYAEQESPTAVEAYRAALDLDDNVPLRLELARTLEMEGDLAGAYDVYRQALSGGGPAGADAFAGMRHVGVDPLRVAEDLKDAFYYTDVLEVLRGTDDPDAMSLRAGAYMGLGRYEEAANAYRLILRSDANDDDALMGLALALAWLGDAQAALDLYSTVDSPTSRIRQAQLLAADEPGLALEYYLESSEPTAWWSATAMLESQGRYTETLPVYARLAKTDVQYADDAAFRLFVLSQRLGDADAESEGRALLAEFGMNWLAQRAGVDEPHLSTMPAVAHDETLLAKVEALERIGRRDLAIQELKFASRYRSAPESLLVVAQALAARGEAASAQRIGEQYIREHGAAPREFWELSYQRPYAQVVNEAAAAFGVDPYLIWAAMREESRFDADALSHAGARGLMQVIPATQMWIADELGEEMAPGDAYDIETSIRMGAWLLGFLTRYFGGDVELAIPAYNAGAGAVETWLSNPLVEEKNDLLRWIGYDETRLYLKRVALSHEIYRALYMQE